VLDGDAEDVWMRVQDNGAGLPSGFDLTASRGLGLQIARTLVEKDLRGKIGITFDAGEGTTAWAHFSRGSNR